MQWVAQPGQHRLGVRAHGRGQLHVRDLKGWWLKVQRGSQVRDLVEARNLVAVRDLVEVRGLVEVRDLVQVRDLGDCWHEVWKAG